jgi:hypothetical protein
VELASLPVDGTLQRRFTLASAEHVQLPFPGQPAALNKHGVRNPPRSAGQDIRQRRVGVDETPFMLKGFGFQFVLRDD